jgi:hypothetical protein
MISSDPVPLGGLPVSTTLAELYQHDQFQAQRQVFKLLGAAFRVKTLDGRLLAYSQQKAFKLREDIRVYTDESQGVELLHIQADRIVDFSAAYKVIDSTTGEHIGSLRRKGWASLFRDSWELLDSEGHLRGRVVEDSRWKALLRRTSDLVSIFLPQTFLIEVDGETVATMRQNFLGFPPRYTIDLSPDHAGKLPRPFAVAAVILLLAIEGRQE